MGNRSLAIADLSTEDVRKTLARTLKSNTSIGGIADYVTSIDWSNASGADPELRRLLGEIEELVHAVEEGELLVADAREQMLALTTTAGATRRTH